MQNLRGTSPVAGRLPSPAYVIDDSGVDMGRYGGTTTAASLAAVALVLGGCGGGDAPDAGGSSPSSSEAPSPSASSESPSESPGESTSTPEPTPEVEPASGPTLEVGAIRVTAPAKFKQLYDTPFTDGATGRVGDGRSGIVLLGAVADDQVGLQGAMRNAFENGRKPPGFEDRGTTSLGGRTAFYYTAPEGRLLLKHVMGLWDAGYLVHIDISLPVSMPTAQQEEIVESVRLTYDSTWS
ncbi:hypothetical protein L2K70_14750 [Nocardioides KLBMP 9356]|uniref:Lipoprotein n=1 Tax=Nocardioides potassii TaxID=2911371 RepID=A0ABS9HCE5_9ACTN|nr:hypothetical protein [Nocardioides potassii]MCF6378872.1 hypothetical protein [Nocardioides potassii]